MPSLTLDRPLFYRELADGCYTPVTYYLAKFIEEAVLASFTSLLFGVIVFWACSLQGSFFVFALAYCEPHLLPPPVNPHMQPTRRCII